MKLITVHLPERYISGIQELVNADQYPNRSEAIRMAVRDLLKAELPLIKNNGEGKKSCLKKQKE